jgi:RHS repeat-associated protein
MTNAAKASVWDAVWLPWGGVQSITGSATMDARFPGQWFQLETGLHYNWHRSYDPSVGRYTQPDPLGFVDGPSVYAYAGGSPGQYVDPDGRQIVVPVPPVVIPVVVIGSLYCIINPQACKKLLDYCRRGSEGGGAGPPPKKDDDPCEEQVQLDEAVCRRLAKPAARSRCWTSSEARYGACRAGKPLPPLITW